MKIDNNTESVAELAKIMKENGLEELTVESESVTISLSAKRTCPPIPPLGAPIMPMTAMQNAPSAPIAPIVQQINGDVQMKPADGSASGGNIVRSPIVGTYYSAPSPKKPPFVKVGDKVAKGQVVCIVESMKLMNEITSDFEGTVADIMVRDGATVEFDQPILRIV